MADSQHLRLVQIGAQSSANDFTSTPTPDNFISPPEIDVSGLTQAKLDRDTLRGANEKRSRVNGVKGTGFSYTLLGRGLGGTIDGTTVVASTNQTELRRVLDIAFGGNGGSNGPATARTVSSVAEATPSITSDATPSIGDGEAVLWSDGTDGEAREVISTSTNTMTLDRGGFGTGTGATIYPSCSWYLDPDAHDPVHVYHRFEGENWRRDAFACAVETLTINIPPNGGIVTFDSSWRATNHTDVAEENPTYSEPTVGTEIVAIDSPFYMGDGGGTFEDDTEWFLESATITVTCELQPRTNYSGANGFSGFHVVNRTATINGRLYLGALTSDGTDALIALLNTTKQTMDVGFQVGRTQGEAMYVRAPNLDMTATIGQLNGMDVIDFQGICTESSNHSNVPGALRIHLF